MHYLDEGAGEAVVMLHGNPTWCFYYRHLVENLRDSYRCIVPDHIGMGLSDKPGDDTYSYTLKQRVDDVEQLLEHLQLRERLTLVVHDWGGMIGMAYAVRHPERVKRIVVLNTGAFPLPDTKSFPWPLWLVRTPPGAFLVRGFNAFSAVAARVCCTCHPMSPTLRRAYQAPYNSWKNRIATLRFVQDIPLRESDESYPIVSETAGALPQFRDRPILICWGMKDFVFDRHFLETWERYWPQAEVHRFPECGHYILEDAQDQVIPLVQRFLQEHPLESAP